MHHNSSHLLRAIIQFNVNAIQGHESEVGLGGDQLEMQGDLGIRMERNMDWVLSFCQT